MVDESYEDEDFTEADLTEVEIVPRIDELSRRGISEEEFEVAFSIAIEDRAALAAQWDGSDGDFPAIEEMPLNLEGVTYKLKDLADIGRPKS